MIFTVNAVELSDRQVAGLLICALEGGSGYWIGSIDNIREIEPSFWTFKDGLGLDEEDGDHWRHEYPFNEGGALIFMPPDDDQEYRLDAKTIQSGLELMAKEYPEHMADAINENEDANTGDVFLQLCLFQDIVYG